jgi:hypothetical protein
MIRDAEIRIKSVCLCVSEQANKKRGMLGASPLFVQSVVKLSLGAGARSAVPSTLALTGL